MHNELRANIKVISGLFIFFFSISAHALPIDWHGVFGVDSTLIDTFRKIENPNSVNPVSSNTGSQEVDLAAGQHANASFQTYLVRLEPVIIVNDSATIKGEISTGYGRGGRLGENSGNILANGAANSFYYYNNNDSTSSKNNLNFNQLYMELYSDTATYQIGRHSYHWGLGALYNSGQDVWNRHLYIRDGLTLNFKIGNFELAPFVAKLGTSDSLTRATKVREHGLSFLYDNSDRELKFGIMYVEKSNNSFNATTQSSAGGSTLNLGKTDVEITDIYFNKKYGKFDFSLEVPLISGELGNVYSTASVAKYKAKAFLFDTTYKFNDSLTFGLNLGHVSGDAGGTSSFDAMFLNPNYQIANLMFRYNFMAVANASGANAQNIFDGSITNTKFLKLSAEYASEKSLWSGAFIYATANEVASTGKQAYNHLANRTFTSNANQDSSYGFEIDLDYTYLWSNEVNFGFSTGYHFVGDYYAFNNQSNPNSTSNSYLVQFKSSINF